MPKVYKIIKLRQLFLSKCLQNNFKTFQSDGFLRFFDNFRKFKKKRGKKSGQNHKKYKIETIFDVNFEKFKMVFWKIFQRKKIFILLFFLHFLLFFCFMNTQKAQNMEWNMRILSSSKRGFYAKGVEFVAKIQQMLQKNFPTILWYLVYFQNFFWMLYQHVPKKNLWKLEQITRNPQKTAFSWANTAGIL